MALWRDSIWFDRALADKLRAVVQGGYVIRPNGRLGPEGLVPAFDVPWIFIGQAPHAQCILWSDVYWKIFRLLPRYCRSRCYKVVANPRTVAQLFELYDLMKSRIGWPSKAGIDRRSYTGWPYAAFFYCTTLEEGRQCWQIVRETIDGNIRGGVDIRVVLKKGCTEMEDAFTGGTPSDTWKEPTAEERDLEEHLDSIFDHIQENVIQPDWHKRYIQFRWLEHAYAIGDTTWMEVIDGNPFGSTAVTYHRIEQPEPGSYIEAVHSTLNAIKGGTHDGDLHDEIWA